MKEGLWIERSRLLEGNAVTSGRTAVSGLQFLSVCPVVSACIVIMRDQLAFQIALTLCNGKSGPTRRPELQAVISHWVPK